MGSEILRQMLWLILFLYSVAASESCGYQSCHLTKDGYINLHMVPHTHDDMGWLKTVDQYYYGVRQDTYPASVRSILDSVVEALKENSDRRFIWVETGFFWKWWLEQPEDVRDNVRNLVNSGQLEFVGGGWSMNDEATTNYLAIIDQMTWGLKKLNDTFGECGRPKVGWQIDPFGHSKEMASIFAQLGFDGLIINRIDYEDKNIRLAKKSMEFIWRGSDSLGASSDIFTSVMFRHYSAPSGLCFDSVLCRDEFLVDDPDNSEYNIRKKAEDFINNYVEEARKSYGTSNILIPFGDDFMYQSAGSYLKNLDKLIQFVNNNTFNGQKYNLIYSTPSCYVRAVSDEIKDKATLEVKTDDFFPYAAGTNNYWTGYYSSRPTMKNYVRYSNNFLQVCKQLNSLTNVTFLDPRLDALREAMGTVQHHDAITGTEKEHVTHDYVKMLHAGITGCEGIANQSLFKLIRSSNMKFETCPLLNVSQCAATELEDVLIITVYNPLSRNVSKHVRLPIIDGSYTIRDPEGNFLVTQEIPISESVLKVPGRTSKATKEVIFLAQNVPPLGFKSYFFEKTSNKFKTKSLNLPKKVSYKRKSPNDWSFSWKNITLDLTQPLLYYNGTDGDSYALKTGEEIHFREISPSVVYEGDLLTEIHQTFSDWVSQIVRMYSNEYFVEFEYLVGPIPDNTTGKEVVSRFSTATNSHSKFYTDTNGRDTLQRIRDYRPTWNTSVEPPRPEKNYYPVTSKISIIDDNEETMVSLLTDRAQGATSLRDGEIELLVHRTCIGEGAYEQLFEEAFGTGVVTRGSHYLVSGLLNVSDSENILAIEKDLEERKFLDSWVFFASNNNVSFEEYREKHVMEV
ncbi:lysosomal alpha-mannosidase-like isoform X2 [Cylas formicarius]|uniref:lysosomal alpha-mannosidase-like isoform X2 n=1 Tax=Cylas formicarius TaxID=197179 RepID=UPI002958BF76|nr:lysosomal alpha-mannosidase-like isoform X2 [Cylas formicarius]